VVGGKVVYKDDAVSIERFLEKVRNNQ